MKKTFSLQSDVTIGAQDYSKFHPDAETYMKGIFGSAHGYSIEEWVKVEKSSASVCFLIEEGWAAYGPRRRLWNSNQRPSPCMLCMHIVPYSIAISIVHVIDFHSSEST